LPSSFWLSCLPVLAQFLIEVRPAFFGEEDPGIFEFDAAAGAGDIFGEPVRPLHIELDVVGAPDDEGGCMQCFQFWLDPERVLVVEGREKTLEILCAVRASHADSPLKSPTVTIRDVYCRGSHIAREGEFVLDMQSMD
jgi:hypothetical protein